MLANNFSYCVGSNEEYTEKTEERILKIKDKLLKEEEKLLNKEQLEFNEILFLKDKLRELESIKINALTKVETKQKEEEKKEAYDNLMKLLFTN